MGRQAWLCGSQELSRGRDDHYRRIASVSHRVGSPPFPRHRPAKETTARPKKARPAGHERACSKYTPNKQRTKEWCLIVVHLSMCLLILFRVILDRIPVDHPPMIREPDQIDDLDNYYTKSDIDNEDYVKKDVDDLDNYYTKSQLDDDFATKSDVDSELGDYYDKDHIDENFVSDIAKSSSTPHILEITKDGNTSNLELYRSLVDGEFKPDSYKIKLEDSEGEKVVIQLPEFYTKAEIDAIPLGQDGQDGADGQDGQDGADGADATVNGTTIYPDSVHITYGHRLWLKGLSSSHNDVTIFNYRYTLPFWFNPTNINVLRFNDNMYCYKGVHINGYGMGYDFPDWQHDYLTNGGLPQ